MAEGSTRAFDNEAREASTADLRRLLAIIDLAYQAVEAPERLGPVLTEVAAAVGAGSALLVAIGDGERRLLADGHADATAAESQVEQESDGRRGRGTRTVPLGAGLELVLDRAELEPSRQRLLTQLIPHLTRAFRLADRLSAIERRTLHAATLERLPTGVAILGNQGQVLFVNRAARGLADGGAPFSIQGGRLVPRHPVARALFESLVDRVVAPVTSGRRQAGGRVGLERPGGVPVELLVVAFDGRIDGNSAAGAVFLSQAGAVPGIEERLSETYELSDSEVRVAVQLVEGCPATPSEQEAEVESVREAIMSLFDKLGSTRQRDLVWLLLRPPGAVFYPQRARQNI